MEERKKAGSIYLVAWHFRRKRKITRKDVGINLQHAYDELIFVNVGFRLALRVH